MQQSTASRAVGKHSSWYSGRVTSVRSAKGRDGVFRHDARAVVVQAGCSYTRRQRTPVHDRRLKKISLRAGGTPRSGGKAVRRMAGLTSGCTGRGATEARPKYRGVAARPSKLDALGKRRR